MRKDYSGQTVTIKDGFTDPFNGEIPAGTKYAVEGYWDEITGGSWMFANANPTCLNYAVRSVGLPMDNEVLYGKIGAFGFLVHVSEVEI